MEFIESRQGAALGTGIVTDWKAFLRAVIDAPDEDGPRLVFADWLEEQGDPRAEFIRLQIELAGTVEELPLVKAMGRTKKGTIPESVVGYIVNDADAVQLATGLVRPDYEVEHEDGRRTRPWTQRDFGYNFDKNGKPLNWIVLHRRHDTAESDKPARARNYRDKILLRSVELLADHEATWAGFGEWCNDNRPFGRVVPEDSFCRQLAGPLRLLTVEWRRGFIHDIRMANDLLTQHGDRFGALFTMLHPVTTVTLGPDTITRKRGMSAAKWQRLVMGRCCDAMANHRWQTPAEDRAERVDAVRLAVQHGLIDVTQAARILGFDPDATPVT